MAREDVYTLEGKLVRKPKTRDSYARTRKAIAMMLATAKVKGENMFVRIGNVKLEDEKFTIPTKMNSGGIFSGDVGKYDGFTDEWKREFLVDDMLIGLEEHFGIGKPEKDEGTEEEEKTKENERRKRLAEMEDEATAPKEG